MTVNKCKCVDISFIIPCYNGEKYIIECILNLKKISNYSIEIIVINDNSNDNTNKICQKLLNENLIDKYIINRNNIGQGLSRNKGLECSQGKWICFLDVDDKIDPIIMKRFLYNYGDSYDVDIVVFGFKYILPDNLERIEITKSVDGVLEANDIARKLFSEIDWAVVSCIGSKIYLKDFLMKNNIRFSNEYKFNEDGAFAITAFSKSKKNILINEPIYIYFVHEGSSMRSYRPNSYHTVNNVIKILEKFIDKYGYAKEKRKYILAKRIGLMYFNLENAYTYSDRTAMNLELKAILIEPDTEENLRNSIFDNELSIKLRLFAILVLYKCNILILFWMYIKQFLKKYRSI